MHEKIRQIEQISLRAWPALETQSYDGWLIRYANGYTGRANSIQVLEHTGLPLEEKIAYCESWYAERDLPCIFRLTDAMQPASLETELDQRGYKRYNETLVQTAPLTGQAFSVDERFHYDAQVNEAWLSAWANWNTVPDDHKQTARQMLSGHNLACCFGWIENIAVGLAVVEDDFVGLFDIVVSPDARRAGYGLALVTSLLGWAQKQAAKTAYLQVTSINAPARALYDTLGFTTHHPYWYRRKK